MIGTNGTTHAKPVRTNWNVRVKLAGYPDDLIWERSPVVGTTNVRVRPLNTKAWLLAYLEMHPEIESEFCTANGIEYTPEERPDLLEVLLPDLFAVVCGKLDGVAGFNSGEMPSLETGLSFRVPVSQQVSINRVGGIGMPSSSAISSKENLVAKIAAYRARLAAAKNDAGSQNGQPTTTEPPASDGSSPEKRRGGKKS